MFGTKVTVRGMTALTALAVLAACGTDAPLAPEAAETPLFQFDYSAGPGVIQVCKYSPETDAESWAEFEIRASVGTLTQGSFFRLDAGVTSWDSECAIVWEPPVDFAGSTVVEITEVGMTPGMTLGSIYNFSNNLTSSGSTAFVTASPGVGGLVIFKNFGTPTLENGGGAGCTPGFWRQPRHTEYWVGFAPSDLFADVFGVDRSGTLYQNVRAKGGGVNALARHAVAALLNSSTPEVDYDLSRAEVIAAVQQAFATRDFESVKNRFEEFNEQGCTVDKSN